METIAISSNKKKKKISFTKKVHSACDLRRVQMGFREELQLE